MTSWADAYWIRWERGNNRFDRLRDLNLIADADELHKLIGLFYESLSYRLGGPEFDWIDGQYVVVIMAVLKAKHGQ